VLGDLIEKCPPAEACRDAFDRMSKATIQMCMSTTGFGPQALRAIQAASMTIPAPISSPSTTYSSEPDARSDTEMTGFLPNTYFGQLGNTRRPIPRFDMNLRDLFSEDETDKRSFSRISNRVSRSMQPPSLPAISQPPSQQIKQEQLAPHISPSLHHPNQQNFSFQQQQQQQQQSLHQQLSDINTTLAPAMSPQLTSQSVSTPGYITNTLPYSNFASTIQSQYPDLGFSDLDFLDSFPVQGANVNATSDVGGLADLGFGMGLDAHHDWSEGNVFDLFDGFFFGPAGGSM
jgi:hypothetical protein